MDPLEEKRNGYSLADCAEILAAHQDLRTEHGEPGFQPHFQQFLRSKGLTETSWASVWNDWNEVTQADAALGAKFHTYMAQVRQRRLMANQPNVAGDAMEGVTLEQYAKISAQVQTGAAIEGLVAGEGLTMEQWTAGQGAWAAKMGTVSPTDPLIIQYGQLYQKYAPNHQAMMEASTQAALEDAANRDGRGGGMSKELTLDNADEFFGHDDIRVRARGAREMIRIWELDEDGRNARCRALTQKAFDEAVAILNDGAGSRGVLDLSGSTDDMDIHGWSAAFEGEQTEQGTSDLVHGSLKDLAGESFMTPAQNDTAQAAVRQAIERLKPRAAKVEELFEAAVDESKKVHLRQLVDDYRETLSDLEETLEDWDYDEPEEEDETEEGASTPPSAPSTAGPTSMPAPISKPPSTDEGILGILKGLPVIGDILRALGM